MPSLRRENVRHATLLFYAEGVIVRTTRRGRENTKTMAIKIDEQMLLSELQNLDAHVNRELFYDQFIEKIEPFDELGSDATAQEEVARATATQFLVNRNAGRLRIELMKSGSPYCSIFQDLNNGCVYTDENGGKPLSEEVQHKLVEKHAVIDDVDDRESYNELAGLEIDGFTNGDDDDAIELSEVQS